MIKRERKVGNNNNTTIDTLFVFGPLFGFFVDQKRIGQKIHYLSFSRFSGIRCVYLLGRFHRRKERGRVTMLSMILPSYSEKKGVPFYPDLLL